MRVSDHDTAPFPPRKKSTPRIAAAFHSSRVGRLVSCRSASQPYRRLPAIRNRTPAISRGGIVSMANRMAR